MLNRFLVQFLLVLATISVVFGANSAAALPINSSVSGLHQAIGCDDPNFCFTTIYSLSGAPEVTGTFDLVGTTLTFSIDLASATLVGTDGPVVDVMFTNVNYSGSFSVVDDGGGEFSFVDQAVDIAGSLSPVVGPGGVEAFNLLGVNVTGVCSDNTGSGGSLVCGLVVGSGADFAINVNGNTRYFRETIDVFSIIPEPNTALLLGLGLAGFAIRSRR